MVIAKAGLAAAHKCVHCVCVCVLVSDRVEVVGGEKDPADNELLLGRAALLTPPGRQSHLPVTHTNMIRTITHVRSALASCRKAV